MADVRDHGWQAAVFVLLANLPDFDFVLSWIVTGDPNRYHHSGTHTLLFAACAGIILGYSMRMTPSFARSALIVGVAVGSHLAVDFMTGPLLGWHRSYGVTFLMPFSPERLTSPFTLFVGPRHNTWGDALSFHNWKWALYEGVMLLPVLAWIVRRRSRS